MIATVKPIKPEERLPIAYEPLILAVSKARSVTWVLGELAEARRKWSDRSTAPRRRGAIRTRVAFNRATLRPRWIRQEARPRNEREEDP